MVDRITHISSEGGQAGKGELIAEPISTPISGFLTATSRATPSCLDVSGLTPCGN